MGGCAVIGQTMINVRTSGARTRISTFCDGIFLFLLVVVFGDFVGTIPLAALVAVTIMVAIGAFDWHSVPPSTLKRMSKSESFVMVAPVVLVLISTTWRSGLRAGTLVASVLFVRRVAHLFSYSEDPEGVVVDLSGPHVWDASTDAALDAIQTKYQAFR